MSEHANGFEPHETFVEFEKRVEQITGMKLADIPKGESADMKDYKSGESGNVFAVHGDICVVGYGTPTVNKETGKETYDEFRVVDISQVNG